MPVTWFWKSSLSRTYDDTRAWTEYSEKTIAEIEKARKAGLNEASVSPTHMLNFKTMVQYQKSDPSRCRPVKMTGAYDKRPRDDDTDGNSDDNGDTVSVKATKVDTHDDAGTSTKPESKTAAASYFIAMEPIEASYEKVGDDKVEYTIKMTKLPGTILEWFQGLWRAGTEEEAMDSYIESTVDTSEKCIHNLSSVCIKDDDDDDDDDDGDDDSGSRVPTSTQVDAFTFDTLAKHLENHLAIEKTFAVTPHSFIFGDTREFDYAYAFFKPTIGAAIKDQLGPLLGRFVKLNDDGAPVLVQDKVVESAYL